MDRLSAVIVCCVMLMVVPWCQAQEGSECIDGRRQAGRCTSIRNCQPLRELLQAVRSNTAGPNALSVLRGSVCSFTNNVPLVCCATDVSSGPEVSSGPTASGRDLLPSRCGVAGITDKIVEGQNASLLAWPWIVLLRGRQLRQQRSVWYCGGVLISERYVLTAAHCFKKGITPEIEFVRVGEHDIASSPDCEGGLCAPAPQDIPVEQVIQHPQYESPCQECNDIALLRLSRPVTLDPLHVVPICLPIDPVKDMGYTEEQFQGKIAWAAGWGSTSRNPFTPNQPSILQEAPLPIGEGSFCSRLKQGYPDTRSTLCAGGLGKDTCKGDSGGPLVLGNIGETKRFVVGITSLGPRVCGRQNTQGLYTSVHYYAQWILDNLRP